MINTKGIFFLDLFRYKKIVKTYGNILREYILGNKNCISIVLSVKVPGISSEKQLYLPEEFSDEDLCQYLSDYVKSDDVNFMFIDAIWHLPSGIPIPDELRLEAKRKYEVCFNELIENGNCIRHDLELIYNEEQEKEVIVEKNDEKLRFFYSIDWLNQTLDYPSILNNFIYIFNFVDAQEMRVQHVSQKTETGTIEGLFLPDVPKHYSENSAFHVKNSLAQLQIGSYYQFLKKHNVRLENVLEWFFTEYLQKEFNCAPMRLFLPSEGTTFAEKCLLICASMESALKQYTLYVEHNAVDFGLITISSCTRDLANIPSLVKRKYVYGDGSEFDKICYLLFSDQSPLIYVKRYSEQGKHYRSLISLLHQEEVYVSDYNEVELYLNYLHFLQSLGLIIIESNERIMLPRSWERHILLDLYVNGVVSKGYYPDEASVVFDKLSGQKLIREKSSLLSDNESSFFNYMLNHAEFDNGYDLRNLYAHGALLVELDENIHRENYFRLLRLFVLLAIKINDDFCLRDIQKQREAKPCPISSPKT